MTSMDKNELLHRYVNNNSNNEYLPESGRYCLYVSHSCPFAHRAILARQLKGLEECIEMVELDPVLPASGIGWHFNGTYPDTINNWQRLKQAYDLTFGENYTGSESEPILWDKKTGSILNNESLDIMRMLLDEFNDFSKNPTLELRPKSNRDEIEAFTLYLDQNFSGLIYDAHLSSEGKKKEDQIDTIFNVADELETRLSSNRFLFSDTLTESDLILFPTLTRFESVYEPLFKINKKKLSEFPALVNYMRDMAKTFSFTDTVRFNINVDSYYGSPMLNPNNVVPPIQAVPDLD